MEAVVLGALLNTILPKLREHIGDLRGRNFAIAQYIEDIKKEVPAVYNSLEDGYADEKIAAHRDKTKLIDFERRLKVLCQETHECIHQFLNPKSKSKTSEARCTQFRLKIGGFKEELQGLKTELNRSIASFKETGSDPQSPYASVGADKVVGMAEPLAEILDLVKLQEEQSAGTEPKVISIVGFGGSGKTVLARQAYHKVGKELGQKAWVTAAGNNLKEVLKNILMQVDLAGNHGETTLDFLRLVECLENYLRGKRYIIVIDEMWKPEQWYTIKNIFRDANSVIIVTTTIQTVANACSKGRNGYVYKLSPLDNDDSRDLFSKECPSMGPIRAVDTLMKKCDGLPVAIVDVAQVIHSHSDNEPTTDACNAARRQLCSNLLKEDCSLTQLQPVLMKKYTGLRGNALRSCLLYFCMYKGYMARLPGRNSLMRRWQAEGFVDPETGRENLKTLVDRNIIQPMGISTDGTTRRCRPTGVMAEYIHQISMSANFAALVSDLEESPNNTIRRLSVHDNKDADVRNSGIQLKLLVTLAVSGMGCQAILDFKKYKLLAVLDLKECTNLKDRHVEDICKLLLLKYLSLGKTIGDKPLPRSIGRLQGLETLEMRTTKTVKVYADVLFLPKLKHLLGNFEVQDKVNQKLRKFLKDDSVLETITGFVTITAGGFPQLMQHMKGLRKVKIVCTDDANYEDREHLKKAIECFIREGTNMAGHSYSLSVDFVGCTSAALEFLQSSGSLTSLKLRGDFTHYFSRSSKQQFTTISGINKLCLSCTWRSGDDVLARLTNLDALEYLKLEGDELDPIVIKAGNFRNLRRLCIVSKKSLQVMKIEAEALPTLTSFHLICKALGAGLQTSIEGLRSLKEIALDYEVDPDIKKEWKAAAKVHSKRPEVLLIQNCAPIRKL